MLDGAETWVLSRSNKRILLGIEMDLEETTDDLDLKRFNFVIINLVVSKMNVLMNKILIINILLSYFPKF